MKVLSNIKTQEKLTTNSPIDDLLDGGIEKRSITQIYGPPGSGKTNVSLNLAVSVAKSGKKIAYVDTEGGISIERIQQLAKDDFEEVANNIIVFEPNNFQEQEDDLKLIESWVASNSKDVDLIVIDSAVALYRVDENKSSKTNKDLGKEMSLLSALARSYDLAVVVTNQIYASFDENNDNFVPVGGTILQYWSKTILELRKEEGSGQRIANLKRHKTIREGLAVHFLITNNGIE